MTAAWLAALVVGASLAVSVVLIPVQVSDSLDVLIEAVDAPSSAALFVDSVNGSTTTLRPMRYVAARWLILASERAHLSYNAVFRGLHGAMVMATILLFVHVVRVRTWVDLAALGLPLTVLIGHHTFVSMLREGYPVNHYAVVTVASLGAVAMAQAPHRWWHDVLLPAMTALTLLMIESGILIWAAVLACAFLRLPGIRRSTVIATTAALLGYAVFRVASGIGAPGIGGYDSGYLDTFYAADELQQRFGTFSLWFFAYNYLGGLGSVFLSEPRLGVYMIGRALAGGPLLPLTLVNVSASLLTTGIIARYAIRHRWRTTPWRDESRLLVVAISMIAVNALLVVAYMKDEMLGVGGVFYAIALFVSMRELLTSTTGVRAAAAVALAAGLWLFRDAGTVYQLRLIAPVTRGEWVTDVEPGGDRWTTTQRGRQLTTSLRREAIHRPVRSRSRLPGWGQRYWRE